MNLSIFAERLAELIFEHNVNAPALAQKLGCRRTTINRYLGGYKMPSTEMLVCMANYFACTTDFLMGLENENYATNFLACPPFAKHFPTLCKELGVSVYRVQKLTGIAESAIYGWLNETRSPNVESLIRIAKALQITLDCLLGRTKLS